METEVAAKPKKRRQGPKRSEASKAAILEATREELVENGWRGFSVDGVARRAKASKQTIYRWWPSIGAMCLDAALALIPDPPSGVRDPIERITAIVLPIEAAARIGNGHYVLRSALLAAADDEDAGEKWRAWQKDQIRAPLRMVLAELAAKHIIRREWDIDDAIEVLLGPLLQRLLIMRAPLHEGYSQQLANRLLRALADED